MLRFAGPHVGSIWPACPGGFASTSPSERYAAAANRCPASRRLFGFRMDLEKQSASRS